MQCETCLQTTKVNVHGKSFCMNCGQQASQRLRDFQAGKTEPTPDNVLDLKQTVRQDTPTNEPKSYPAKSLHGMHAKGFHAQMSPQGRTGAYTHPPTPVQEDSDEQPQATAVATTDDKARQETARQELEKQIEMATPVDPQAINQPIPEETTSFTEPAAQITHMEPHQTYPLKSDSPVRHQTEAVGNQQLHGYEGMASEQSSDAPPPPKRSWWRALFPANLFKQSAVRAVTIGLCVVVLAGYVTYLNYPNIAVRVAASRANVNASMPEYVPDGYSFNGPISYSQGQLAINFAGRDNTITVSQSRTRWDSQSLLENYINRQTSHYDTYRQNGLTIYTYDNRHAAWVNGGVLYKIESDSYLDQTDIVNMASSM